MFTRKNQQYEKGIIQSTYLVESRNTRLARFLQIISSALASLPIYYAALPEEFKTAIPSSYLKYIAIAGGVCVFVLQFFNKKQP